MKTFTFFRNLVVTCLLLFAMQSMSSQNLTRLAVYNTAAASWVAGNNTCNQYNTSSTNLGYCGYRSSTYTNVGTMFKIDATEKCSSTTYLSFAWTRYGTQTNRTIQVWGLTSAPTASATAVLNLTLLGSIALPSSSPIEMEISGLSNYTHLFITLYGNNANTSGNYISGVGETSRRTVSCKSSPAACSGSTPSLVFVGTAQGDYSSGVYTAGTVENVQNTKYVGYRASAQTISPAGRYSAVVYNVCNASQCTSATLEVTFTASIGSQTVYVYKRTSEWLGSTSLDFGTVLTSPVVSSNSYTFNLGDISDAKQIIITAKAVNTSAQISTIKLNCAACTAPSITTQPQAPAAFCQGESGKTLSVVASGTATLSYQWRKGGTDISGATSSSYEIPTTETTGGSYTCYVSNSCGNVTSTAATVTINPKPTGLSVSGGGATCANSVELTPSTVAGSTIYYQTSATGTVTTDPVSTSKTVSAPGTYYFRAQNNSTSCWGDAVTVAVTKNTAPSIATDIVNKTYCQGDAVTQFSVAASGTPTPTAQWQSSPDNSQWNNISAPTLSSATAGTTYYRVVYTNTCGTATTSVATVTVNAKPTAVSVSTSGTPSCSPITLTATNGGSGIIYWQGTTSGGTSTGEATNTKTVSVSDTYYFRAHNGNCWSEQGNAVVIINQTPVVNTSPASRDYVLGETPVQLSASLSGTPAPTPTVKWQYSTNNSTWTDCDPANVAPTPSTSTAGITYYRVVYSNSCGNDTSKVATIRVSPECATGESPTDEIVDVAVNATLSWTAVDGATSYDVYLNTDDSTWTNPKNTAGNNILLATFGNITYGTHYYWKVVPKNTAGAAVGCTSWEFTTIAFVPVDSITGIPEEGCPHIPINLKNLAVVHPNNATNQKISWSVENDGGTNSTLTGDVLVAKKEGSIKIRAIIVNGLTPTTMYYKDFIINMSCKALAEHSGIKCENPVIYEAVFTLPNNATTWTGVCWREEISGSGIISVEIRDEAGENPVIGTVFHSGEGGGEGIDEFDGNDCGAKITRIFDLTNNKVKVRVTLESGLECTTGAPANPNGGSSEAQTVVQTSAGSKHNTKGSGVKLFSINMLNDAILPISLLDFIGDCHNGHVNLNWHTATETNNDYFTIERSANGIQWTEIAQIKGAGNSNQELQYSYIDHVGNIGENIYYRLKQTDYNGDFKHFVPIVVRCIADQDSKITVYPNPTSGMLHIDSGNKTILDAKLFSIDGRMLQQIHNAEIDMSKYTIGVYFLRVNGETVKVVKN